MRPLALLLPLLLLTGCGLLGSRTGDLALFTDAEAYAPGADLTLALENESARRYEMLPLSCAGLQRRKGEGWEPANADPDVVCAAILVGLGPGERVEAQTVLPEGLGAGTYRFAHHVSRDLAEDPDGLAVHSNAFRVE